MFSPDSTSGPNIPVITIVCGWLFTAMAMLALLLLVWSKRIRDAPFRIDDYFTFLAFLIAIGLVIHTTWAVLDEGLGKQLGDLSKKRRAEIVKSLMANEVLWGLVNMVIRTTALSFLYAMFSASKAVQLVALTLMVLSGLYGLAVLFTIFLICHPAAAAWDTSISGTCGCQIVSYISLEILGALVDLAILALPIIALRPLQMSLRQKCEVLGWLSIGAVVFIVTGLRIQALHFVDSPDFTFSNGYLGLLSVLGALLGVICCCVPSFRPILRRVFQKMSPDNESDVANKVVAESSFETSSRAITSPQATHIPPSRPELEQWGPISHIEHVTHDLSAKRFSNNDTYTIALSVHNV